MSADPPPDGPGAEKEGLWSRLTAGFRNQPQSRRDIERVLAAARAGRLLDADEQAMLEGVMAVSDTQVRDIMIPRAQMVVIERDADPRAMLEIMMVTILRVIPVHPISPSINRIGKRFGIMLIKPIRMDRMYIVIRRVMTKKASPRLRICPLVRASTMVA